jgi:hypothetical protein
MGMSEHNGKLHYFDANCMVGRPAYPHYLDLPDSTSLLGEMDRAGVDEALVYHVMARDADPPLGNRLLMDEIHDEPRLHPCWILLPQHTEEMPPPDILLKEMEKNDVRAARLYPTKDFHSFSMADWSVGSLLSALEDAKVPVIMDIEIVWWETIHTVMERHPKLRVIANSVSYRHNRFSYPLFEKYEHLYVEMSRYMGAGTIEQVCRKYGASHILFGSNMPQYTASAAIPLVTYAEISGHEKAAIAGDTLKQLLAEAYS